jgi:hypothetical protein
MVAYDAEERHLISLKTDSRRMRSLISMKRKMKRMGV